VIKVSIGGHVLDPHGRTVYLLARVFRELAEKHKQSTIVEIVCKPEDPPVRLQLRVLTPKILKGSPRPQRRPPMANSNRSK
jgi:hypothetical protein